MTLVITGSCIFAISWLWLFALIMARACNVYDARTEVLRDALEKGLEIRPNLGQGLAVKVDNVHKCACGKNLS